MCENIKSKETKLEWKYILRQVLISSSVWTSHFIGGLNVGTPTVLIPQLKKESKFSNDITLEQISWLASIIYYSSLPWAVVLPVLSKFVGRKIPYIIMCTSTIIGFVIFYFSSDVQQIIISEIFQGVAAASLLTMSVVIITEYTSPVYRGIIYTINIPSFFWGILAANTIGTFFHWKIIPLFGLICTTYCLLIAYFWPESPLWLVKKGNFEKCMESHRCLKGSSSQSEKELMKLIADNQHNRKKLPLKRQMIDFVQMLFKKDFYKPLFISLLLLALYVFTGKQICAIYAIDILSKISSDTSTIYASMLILDVVTIISMFIGCGLTKLFRRRALLLNLTIISNIFLFSLATYLFAVKLSIVSESVYVSLPLLVGFSVAVSCGPMILCICISGELIPLESRSTALCITALLYKSSYGSLIKFCPYIFQNIGMHGAFFLFGLTSSICLVLVYFYLPETKDKTLQEIADSIKGIKAVEEAKELMPIISDKRVHNSNQTLNNV